MAPRLVVADSEDEDEEVFSPVKFVEPIPATTETEPPEVEPLSPIHQPQAHTQHGRSGSTDTTFFASVYNEQHQQAMQQPPAVEDAARLGQKASASSGDISLPAVGKAKKKQVLTENGSSATDVTSPAVQSRVVGGRAAQRKSQLSEGTEITTPEKSSAKDEWDVPSSGDEGPVSRIAKSAWGKNDKTHGKRKRADSHVANNAMASGLFAGAELQVTERPDESSSSHSSTKKRRSVDCVHGDVENKENGTFYVAASNLTPRQKLQYQQVRASPEEPPEVMGPPATKSEHLSGHKSSGATTIAYSTPSRFASSGPRATQEAPKSGHFQAEDAEGIIDLTSSPDVITSAPGGSKRRKSTQDFSMQTPQGGVPNTRSPAKSSTTKSSAKKKKRKEKAKAQTQDDRNDDDELAYDDSWDSEAVGFHRENYKPRPSRRRSIAESLGEEEADVEPPLMHIDDGDTGSVYGDAASPVQPPKKKPKASEAVPDKRKSSTKKQEAKSEPPLMDIDDGDTGSIYVDAASPDQQPRSKAKASQVVSGEKPEPKKRGRKKKQPVSEDTIGDNEADDEQIDGGTANPPQPDGVPVPDFEQGAPVDKPKKKRGRPKKSKATKVEETRDVPSASTLDNEANDSTYCNKHEANSPEFRDESENVDPPSKAEANAPVSNVEEVSEDFTPESRDSETEGKKSVSPLKEVDNNAMLRSQSTVSDTDKSLTASATKLAPSQAGKVAYRVGLSRKSKIAPLLKSFRK